MAWELRELQGNIFDNQYKETEKQPDMKGEFLLNGKHHEIAIWRKQGAKGPFLGFKISEKLQKQEQSISQQATAKIRKPDPISSGLPPKRSILPDDMDGEEIPF